MKIIKRALITVLIIVSSIVASFSDTYAILPEDGSVYINVRILKRISANSTENLTCPSFDIQVDGGSDVTVEDNNYYGYSRSETITWSAGTVITLSNVEIPDGYTKMKDTEDVFTYTLTDEDHELIQSSLENSYTENYIEVSFDIYVYDSSMGIVSVAVTVKRHDDWNTSVGGKAETFDVETDNTDSITITDGSYSFPLTETLSWEPGTTITVSNVSIPDGYVQLDSEKIEYTYTITEDDYDRIQSASSDGWDGEFVEIDFSIDVYNTDLIEGADFTELSYELYKVVGIRYSSNGEVEDVSVADVYGNVLDSDYYSYIVDTYNSIIIITGQNGYTGSFTVEYEGQAESIDDATEDNSIDSENEMDETEPSDGELNEFETENTENLSDEQLEETETKTDSIDNISSIEENDDLETESGVVGQRKLLYLLIPLIVVIILVLICVIKKRNKKDT